MDYDDKSEIVNVSFRASWLDRKLIVKDSPTNFNGIIVISNINTLFENEDYKFDISNIIPIFREMSNIETLLLEQTKAKLNINED